MAKSRVSMSHPNSVANSFSSAKDMAAARNRGENVDSWSNPDWTGGGALNPDGTRRFGSGAGGAALGVGDLVDLPDVLSGSKSYSDLMELLQGIADKNNAWSASQAQKQMDFQSASADKAMKFNADQAALDRKWQEYMSNTAHQREIKDLKAAGLNPVLSANAGAPVTSGATASGYASSGAMGETDHSTSGALVGLLGSMLSAQTQLASTALSARSQEAIADKYTSMQELVAKIQQETSYGVAAVQRGTTLDAANISALSNQVVAKIHAGATVSAAQLNAEAAKVSASIHAAAQKYGYDLNAMTQRDIAAFNRMLQRELADKGFNHDLQMQYNSQTHEMELMKSGKIRDLRNDLLSDTVTGLFDLGKAGILSGMFSGSNVAKGIIGFHD